MQVEDPVESGGAEERRLRRIETYAARRGDREGNTADDALMVDQGSSTGPPEKG